MIKQSVNFFKQAEKTENNKNNYSANESMAKEFPNILRKVFSSVDLWNIQRNGKSAMQRRSFY